MLSHSSTQIRRDGQSRPSLLIAILDIMREPNVATFGSFESNQFVSEITKPMTWKFVLPNLDDGMPSLLHIT